ncbi:Allatostatin-A receptor [Holothuria leucospilota]|uniref:Allatostatin-A receptor n=1 Tax=Holothuria leucospilota TaxID=206669 RepID=A0A9Q1HBM2_HOLLE|nr:Allatostatin-A receptor [Holothuria leucospilota]
MEERINGTSSSTTIQPIYMKLCFTLIALVGLTGNGLVLFVFYKVPNLRVFTNILIGHQSLIDFISSILLFFTFVLPIVSTERLQSMGFSSPNLANFICKLWASEFFFWAVIKTSTVNLVCLTIERYFAVVHPIKYRKKAGKESAKIVCTCTWLIGSLTVLYIPIIHGVSEDGKCIDIAMERGTWKSMTIGLGSLLSTVVIPLLVMVFVYVKIIKTLRSTEMAQLPGQERSVITSGDDQKGSYTVPLRFQFWNLSVDSAGLFLQSKRDLESCGNRQRSTNVLTTLILVPNLRVFTNILIGHQSLIDFISSILLFFTFVPSTVSTERLQSMASSSPNLANFICKLWASEFFFWAVIKTSTVNLVCLTIERYFAVVHPIKYRKKAGKESAKIVCTCTWLIGSLTVLYIPIIHGVSEDGKCIDIAMERGTWKSMTIGLGSLLSTVVIPLLVMVFVYVKIIKTLRSTEMAQLPGQSRHIITSGDDPKGSYTVPLRFQFWNLSVDNAGLFFQSKRDLESCGNRQRSTNVLTTLILVCVSYLICWIPDQLLYFHHIAIRPHDWTKPSHRFLILLASCNVFINPIIYTFKYRSFQKGLRQIKWLPSVLNEFTINTFCVD